MHRCRLARMAGKFMPDYVGRQLRLKNVEEASTRLLTKANDSSASSVSTPAAVLVQGALLLQDQACLALSDIFTKILP